MGQKVLQLARMDPRFNVVAGVSRERSTAPSFVPILPDRSLAKVLGEADVLIEFSNPLATLAHLELCARAKVPAVVGTTGFSGEQFRRIERLARSTAVFVSPNMSLGMNLIFRLALEAASLLKGWDSHIVEAHHKGKKDAPSGTALKLAQTVLEAKASLPPISSIRAGDIVGDHTLVLAGPFERVELTHRAHAREAFAAGALQAAAWVHDRRPGLYDFSHLMGT